MSVSTVTQRRNGRRGFLSQLIEFSCCHLLGIMGCDRSNTRIVILRTMSRTNQGGRYERYHINFLFQFWLASN